MSEHTPLLQENAQQPATNTSGDHLDHAESQLRSQKFVDDGRRIRQFVTGPLLFIVLVVMVFLLIFGGQSPADRWLLRGNPHAAAERVLNRWPVIDGHIDLPEIYRTHFANNATGVDLNEPTYGHVDIPRLRQGKVGAFWWSAYIGCPGDWSEPDRTDEGFLVPSWRVRDTLEQIDVAKVTMEVHSKTFQLALSTGEAKAAMSSGKIAGFIGLEGGHQLGNSLAVLRQYYALGVRYLTLTHLCHNAFADSGGFLTAPPPLHYGLSPLGMELVREMNRLGMIVDLSHTSDQTAIQAMTLSRAPVMWSHSSARSVWDVSRNVPDDILQRIGLGKGKRDAVVMVNFAPYFVAAEGKATVEKVADHVEHIAKIAGKAHVGIGSDYDGIEDTPIGLEDVSKYPNLFAVLIKRGWTPSELAGLAGGNFFRVFHGVERVAREMRSERVLPNMALWEKRTDIPGRQIGSKLGGEL